MIAFANYDVKVKMKRERARLLFQYELSSPLLKLFVNFIFRYCYWL